MGIRGLTTYIENRKHIYFKDFELHDSKIVIDGDSLCKLYNRENFYKESSHTYFCFGCYGGDYDKYAETLRIFFNVLKECNITPYIIYGGGYESYRVPLIKERLSKRVKNASNITPDLFRYLYGKNLQKNISKNRLSEKLVYPVGLRHTLMDMVNDLHLNVYASIFESDNEVACLAKQLKCPAISMDSDFFIFGSMYIPFESLDMTIQEKSFWRDRYKYISCQIFEYERLVQYLNGTDNSLFPKHYLLPVLFGNDYIAQSTFKNLFESMNVSGNEYRKNCKIFDWLVKQPTLTGAMEKILNSFETDEKPCIYQKVKQIILGYMPVPTDHILEHFKMNSSTTPEKPCINFTNLENQLGLEIKGMEMDTSGNIENNVPELFKKKFTQFKYPPFFLEMLLEDRYLIQPDIDDSSRPDANTIGYHILSAIHKILVQNDERVLMVLRRNEHIELEEYSLDGYTSPLPSVEEIEHMNIEPRKEIIFQILEVDEDNGMLESFPEEWHIFLLSLKYFLLRTKFQPPPSFNYSLILSFIIINYVDQKLNGFYRIASNLPKLSSLANKTATAVHNNKLIFSVISERDCLVFMHKICPYFEINPKDTDETFDRTIMHSMAEFKCIFLHLKFLNNLLNYPFENTGLCKIFGGTFIYNLTKKFKSVPMADLESYFSIFLKDCPNVLSSLFYVVGLLKRYNVM